MLVKAPEKDGLKAAIDAAKDKEEANFTPETWAPFAEALKAAEEVYANADATAEMVQDATNALLDASEKLEEVQPEPEKPSKDALKKAIDAAKELKKEDYTADSWKAFSNALQKAQVVYDNADATAEEIAKAVADLEAAQKNLVEKSGWVETTDGWEYYEDGKKVTGWKEISKHWYYFSANGIMATGWVDVDGTWYYMNNSGAMATGWVDVDGTWYYMHADGSMAASEWIYVGDEWYYLNADGTMATNQWIGGYYVGASGKME